MLAQSGFFGAPFVGVRELEHGRLAFAGVPGEVTGMQDGTKFGPDAVRLASQLLASRWENESGVFDPRFERFVRFRPDLGAADLGDLALPWHRVDQLQETISNFATEVASAGVFPAFVGGDHYVTFPLVEGLLRAGKVERLGYIQIDAHLDFDATEISEPHTHGTSARRISELDRVSAENMVWMGVEDTCSAATWEHALRSGARIITVSELRALGLERAANEAIEHASRACDGLYISLDIDVITAAYAPGTTYVNLLGLAPAELFALLRVLGRCEHLSAVDLVEIAPPRDLGARWDRGGFTAKIGAWALSELIGERLIEVSDEPFAVRS